MTNLQINTLYTLFLYLVNATLNIPDEHRLRVFKDMAFKLHQWNDVPISVLRKELQAFEIDFNDTCSYCGEEMVDGVDGQEFCSYACKVNECGCKACPTCCGRDDSK